MTEISGFSVSVMGEVLTKRFWSDEGRGTTEVLDFVFSMEMFKGGISQSTSFEIIPRWPG